MSSTQVAHSLAFRVMRLCRSSFHVETSLRFDPCDLIGGEDFFDDPVAASHFPGLLSKHSLKSSNSDFFYRSRFLLHDPSDTLGLLVFPQAFDAIYLGFESRKGEGMDTWHSLIHLEVKRSLKMMENMKDKVDEWKDTWQDKNEDGRVGSFRWLLDSYCWKFFPTNICL